MDGEVGARDKEDETEKESEDSRIRDLSGVKQIKAVNKQSEECEQAVDEPSERTRTRDHGVKSEGEKAG